MTLPAWPGIACHALGVEPADADGLGERNRCLLERLHGSVAAGAQDRVVDGDLVAIRADGPAGAGLG